MQSYWPSVEQSTSRPAAVPAMPATVKLFSTLDASPVAVAAGKLGTATQLVCPSPLQFAGALVVIVPKVPARVMPSLILGPTASDLSAAINELVAVHEV